MPKIFALPKIPRSHKSIGTTLVGSYSVVPFTMSFSPGLQTMFKLYIAIIKTLKVFSIWRFPEIGLPPVIIHFSRWDFPWNKPSSYWGTLMSGNLHMSWPFLAPISIQVPSDRCLSQCLDWGRIIKKAEQFWTEGLKGAARRRTFFPTWLKDGGVKNVSFHMCTWKKDLKWMYVWCEKDLMSGIRVSRHELP